MFETAYLDYSEIIHQVEESAISRLFLSMEYGKKYSSLFRKDSTPSASLYCSRNGRLRYNDFVENLTIPSAVMKLKGWTYSEFIEKIYEYFNINSSDTYIKHTSSSSLQNVSHDGSSYTRKLDSTIIQIKKREFLDSDIRFWSEFGISVGALNLYNVFSISHFWINGRIINGSEYCYSYDFYWEDNVFRRKIYQPFDKRFKWFSNGGKVCQGEINMPTSGDLLIITKSLKDVMTLHELGYQSVAPPSESVFLPEQYFLKQKERFKRIVIWYDNDFDKELNTGQLKGLEFSNQYGIENIFISSKYEVKDISDFYKKYGREQSINLINKLLYEENEEFHEADETREIK
jgi:hypothetical protein